MSEDELRRRPVEDVLAEALQLAAPDRARLAACLLESLDLDAAPFSLNREKWLLEIEDRARASTDGEPGTPWERARMAISERLAGW